MKPLVITLDGPSGVGKSTVARKLARRLGVLFLDTGATYRALAIAAVRAGLDPERDVESLRALAEQFPMRLEQDARLGVRVFLGEEEVTDSLRTEAMSLAASKLAQHAVVRAALVERQRQIAADVSVVAEGRDTGSVVFPNANFKFYLDASIDVRAKRRQKDLRERFGVEEPLEQLKAEISQRDERDRNREAGPLVQPVGAIVINTDGMTIEDNVEEILKHIQSS